MKMTHTRPSRLTQVLLGAVIVFTLVMVREAKAGDENEQKQHLVTDWSHRHLTYSEPHSLMQRFQLSTDPRYVQQVARKNAERRGIGRDQWRWYHAPENPRSLKGDWSMDMGAGATVGAGNYPAKYTFDSTTANCATDFVVYNTGLAGSASQASIVAFNNIYSVTCGATVPTTYWSYNTGSGAVVTSPVLSYDGAQVAFIQNTAGASNLVVLRWKASNGTLAIPVTPGTGPCLPAAAPCQTSVALSTATVLSATATPAPFSCTGVDSHSSPFYDYGQDVLYVGDDSGCLHKFTGVFLGTPTEVLASGANVWPAALTTGFGHLNSPVSVAKTVKNAAEVLITGADGEVYAVDTTIGGVYPSGANSIDPQLTQPGFDDAALVDVTAGEMYVFARKSSTFVGGGTFPGTPNVPSVFEIAIPANPSAIHAAAYTQGIVSDTGAAVPSSAVYVGTFDDLYYSSGTNSGYMYTCSTHNTGTTTVNALWVITVTSGVMVPATIALGPSLTTANVGCSPITEFNNTGTTNDRIFLSVTGSPITAAPISCTSALTGCIMSFDVDSPLLATSATSATAAAAGGTSGIVVDNSAAVAGGASQVYFTPLSNQACAGAGGVGIGTGGCAIQASQSALR